MKYPMSFEVTANSAAGIQQTWSTGAGSQQVTAAIPPEFEGPGGGYSPEDLYAMALTNCFVATFKVFAEKSRLGFSEVRTRAHLEVDRDDKGRPWMARFHLAVQLSGASSVETAQRLLERTSQNCMILNSVRTEKTFSFEVVPA